LCDDEDPDNKVCCKIDELQYNAPDSGYTEVTDTLYVYKGESISFKAIPDSCKDPFPNDKPVWSVSWNPTGEWTGDTKEFTFDTVSSSPTDYKTVTVECGNTKTANVIVCEVETSHIKFDHSSGDSGDGIDIRESYSTDISVPEWVKGGQNKPAAYKKSISVTIKARLTVSPAVTTSAKVSATATGTVFGNLGEQTVNFSSGVSNPEYVSFTPANNTQSQIDYDTVQWQWEVKRLGVSGSTLYNTNLSGPHTIYTVLATPTSPMTEPWVSVLDIAVPCAFYDTTESAAMYDIWNVFYHNLNGTYDTVSGAPRYGSSTNFNATGFVANANLSNIGTVNCYDMGKAVMVFGNSLGCNASFTFVSPFGYLNCVKPIGCGWTNNPFHDNSSYNSNAVVGGDDSGTDGRSSFANHAFSTITQGIYDGSAGYVDVDSDPDDGPNFTSHALDGNDTWNSSYKTRVIDDNPSTSTGSPQNYSISAY